MPTEVTTGQTTTTEGPRAKKKQWVKKGQATTTEGQRQATTTEGPWERLSEEPQEGLSGSRTDYRGDNNSHRPRQTERTREEKIPGRGEEG